MIGLIQNKTIYEYDIRSLILAFMLGEKIELTDHVDSIYDFILDVDYKYQEIIMKLYKKGELEDEIQLLGDYENKKIICHLDSEKTYRVLENLCQNICKYALEHTRVYLQIVETNQQVIVVFKNISAHEISNPGDLTERFVQGDASRKSEGSGLGLAICKSFVEVQGGTFEVNVDGDLFKTTIIFPKKIEND